MWKDSWHYSNFFKSFIAGYISPTPSCSANVYTRSEDELGLSDDELELPDDEFDSDNNEPNWMRNFTGMARLAKMLHLYVMSQVMHLYSETFKIIQIHYKGPHSNA